MAKIGSFFGGVGSKKSSFSSKYDKLYNFGKPSKLLFIICKISSGLRKKLKKNKKYAFLDQLCQSYFLLALAFQQSIICENPVTASGLK